MKKAAVIGAGAWGTALAAAIARAGRCEVTLWAMEPEVVASINKNHENTLFLPNVELPYKIKATNNLTDILDCDLLYLVSPAQFLRKTCANLAKVGLDSSIPLILCSKGIEQGSLKLMTEVVEETVKNPYAVLSGPTFAIEVAKGLPASVVLACIDKKLCKRIAHTIESTNFKVYRLEDVIGAEIGGAVKNVIAIACGIAEGKELGQNAQAALITRGLKEMKRLGVAKGCRLKTLMELCGVGDLILTCSSHDSRNTSLGYALGQGKTLEEIMKTRRTVAEGVASAESVTALAEKLGVKVPICEAVNKIIHGKADIKETIETLVRSS